MGNKNYVQQLNPECKVYKSATKLCKWHGLIPSGFGVSFTYLHIILIEYECDMCIEALYKIFPPQ